MHLFIYVVNLCLIFVLWIHRHPEHTTTDAFLTAKQSVTEHQCVFANLSLFRHQQEANDFLYAVFFKEELLKTNTFATRYGEMPLFM